MAYVLVKLMVDDYGRWRSAFDHLQPASQAHGSAIGRVFRSSSNPNEVFVLNEWPDFDRAQAFLTGPELREAQQQAGVQGRPTIYYLNEV